MTVEQLTRDALALPAPERARLADQLLESLEEVAESPGESVQREWAEEIERRRERVRLGDAKQVPWESARQQLRRDLEERRQR